MSSADGTFAAEGWIIGRCGPVEGYVIAKDGIVSEIGDGHCPVKPDFKAVVVPEVINSHTHCADYGLRIPPGMTLQELVAPPDGLKHRYLREAGDDVLGRNMEDFARDSASFGSSTFIDFRENGLHGCKLLRERAPGAVVLGRPTSPEFDPNEIGDILSVADGIGISSISDMDHAYIEAVADEVRAKRGIFAIHVSERVREDIDFVLSLDPAFVVHMCEATDSDLSKCAEAEVPIVVCPRSNRYFGKVPPIARMFGCGADVAIGTDNGMICRPDMKAEAAAFLDILECQGGDPSEVWKALSLLGGKILNRPKVISGAIQQADMMVLPFTGVLSEDSVFRGESRPVGLINKKNRRM